MNYQRLPNKLRPTFDILLRESVSRHDAAARLGIGLETARNYIMELIRAGLAYECGHRLSDADRQIKLYRAVPGAEWPKEGAPVRGSVDYAAIDAAMRSMVAYGKESRV